MNVSICIPTYNQSKYIEEAIRSANNQSILPIEIIVSDDCSTDGTADVLHKLCEEISILKVEFRSKNLGITKNVDGCLRMAKGDFIIRLDSDDVLAPNYLEILANALCENISAGYAHGAVQEIDQNGNYLQERKLFRKPGLQTGEDALESALKGYRVAANIIMFRKEALEKVNFLTSPINFAEDYHLAVSIATAGYGNVYVNETLSYYRVWTDANKVRSKRKLSEIAGLRTVFSDILEPSFEKRHWNKGPIKKSREAFACRNADCLQWDIYTNEEKYEIEKELYKLSSTKRVRLYVWMYKNKLGIFIKTPEKAMQGIKVFLKRFF